jgi:hypothetical protein
MEWSMIVSPFFTFWDITSLLRKNKTTQKKLKRDWDFCAESRKFKSHFFFLHILNEKANFMKKCEFS